MKRIVTITLGTVIAFMALIVDAGTADAGTARDAALATADDLVAVLVDVQDLAGRLAVRAARRGDQHDAHALANVKRSAETLEQKVTRQIVLPLEDGATFAFVKAQVVRLSTAFELLADDADEVRRLPVDLADLIDEVEYLRQDLADGLARGDRDRPGRPGRDDHEVTQGR